MAKPTVAFMGLGIMGSGMAERLLNAGFPLVVYNRTSDKSLPFARAGASAALSPREAASQAQIIVSMVSDDLASRSVWLGENGALTGAPPGAVLIESSTVSIEWIKELAAEAARRGCNFLDAPVTGTKPHAASGELLFLVGGSKGALAAAQPVFSVLGRDAIHLGPAGSGTLMKLINNFVCGVEAACFAEAMAMVEASDLDRSQAFSILNEGAPGSGILRRISERIIDNDFSPNFHLRWMAKDLSYALDAAFDKGIALMTAGAALALFERAVSQGHGSEDFSAVVKTVAVSMKP